MTTQVGIYVRVSTKEQAIEGYSIGEQTERLQKFCEAHDWQIFRIYTDAGFSGADTNRPALQELLSDVRAGRITKVLVYKLDRLSRSQKDTLKLIEDEFLQHNVAFESMTEKLDTGTAHGRAMIGILAAFAQLEKEMIHERMSLGIEARIKEGKWRGGFKVPFGYDYDQDQGKLVINEYQAMIVRYLFQQFTEGRSISAIAKDLETKGWQLSNGKCNRRSLQYILQNKTYCGYLKHGSEWLCGLHTAIIDEDTYNSAQAILKGHIASNTSPQTTLLGGLLYCGQCGARYGKTKTGTSKYGYRYKYGCYSRSKKVPSMVKDPDCRNKYYDMADLDTLICDQIRKLALDPAYLQQLKESTKQSDTAQQITAIQQQIRHINSQLSRFMDLYGLGKYSIEDLDAKTQPLMEQRNKLQQELTMLQATKTITDDQVLQLVRSFDEAMTASNMEEKQRIIHILIDKIIIDVDDVTIHWNFI